MAADYVSLVFRPLPPGAPRHRLVHLYSGTPSPESKAQAYRDGLHRLDPMPYHSLEDGRVYALAELLRPGEPDHDFYRAQMLVPSGMNVMRMMRVEEPGGTSAWMIMTRRKGEFGAAEEALMAGLAPYLRAALQTHVALERERMQASVAAEAIRRLNFGWLTLDGQGRILDIDAHGEALLADSAILRRGKSGVLTATAPTVAAEIQSAVEQLAGAEQARPRAIVLSREPWLDMLLVSTSVKSGATRPEPELIAYLHADNWSSADRCDQLGELFDLLPSEARLALALSRGMSIAEAADDLGLTVESARTYSKRIYAKTGARGQADLVRFIHRSIIAIA